MLGRAGTDGSTQLYNTHDLRISGTEIYCYIHNISRLFYNIRCQKWQLSRFQKVGHKETMKIHAKHFIHKMMGNIKVKIYFAETIILWSMGVRNYLFREISRININYYILILYKQVFFPKEY